MKKKIKTLNFFMIPKIHSHYINSMLTDSFLSRNFGLIEPMCDKDGLYNGCLMPSEQSRIIFYISCISTVTGIIGIYYGHTWLGLTTIIGSLFGQFYWQNPTISLRRILDMAWVQLAIWSHLWFAVGSPVFVTYAIIQFLGSASYGISWYLTKQGNSSWAATFFHSLVHIAANSSLLILYTGTPAL
jgi:hypothetical protein